MSGQLLDIPADGPEDMFTPAATAEQVAMLRWARDHPIDRPTIPVSNGRYMAPHPTDGKVAARTRVTTFIGALDSSEGLEIWRQRLLVGGLLTAPELLTHEAMNGDPAAIVAAALHAGGEKLAADIGTAVHLACEHADMGATIRPPDPYAADVDAYTAMLASHGLTIVELESTAWVEGVEAVGTIDRLVSGPWGDTLRVLDLKTGSSYKHPNYAVQLACYAHASHLWSSEGWKPAPSIDREVAYLAHMPAGTGEATLVAVDIVEGWRRALVCAEVRNCTGYKGLFTLPDPTPASDDTADVMTARIAAVCAAPNSKAALAAAWPTGVPKKAPWTPEQIAAIEPALTHAEAPAPEPTPPHSLLAANPDDGGPCEHSEREALKARAAELDQPRVHQCAGWRAEGKRGRNPWGGVVDGAWTMRCFADNRAALLCSLYLYDAENPDALTRAALALVLGQDLQPTWTTGAVIGSLTIEQADQLAAVAEAFGRGDTETCAALGLRITAA